MQTLRFLKFISTGLCIRVLIKKIGLLALFKPTFQLQGKPLSSLLHFRPLSHRKLSQQSMIQLPYLRNAHLFFRLEQSKTHQASQFVNQTGVYLSIVYQNLDLEEIDIINQTLIIRQLTSNGFAKLLANLIIPGYYE